MADQRVEAFDEAAVASGFVAPAAGLGVLGQRLGVDALGGEDGKKRGLGAEVRAVLADVRVGADALGGGAQAVAAGESGLDERQLAPVAVADARSAGRLGQDGSEAVLGQGERRS